MKRLLYKELLLWKESKDRKPLILNGARQVGKTWLLQSFGESEYKKMAYISCEKLSGLESVFADFDTRRIVRALSAISHVDITPSDTLVIIDEVQEYPRALTALKYFCEDAPEYHIAVAGSLLGVTLHRGVSFPVGKVDILQLYPMTFSEFVEAVDGEQSAEVLRSGDWPLIGSLHSHYVELLRQYYFVGGMPGAVSSYCEGAGPAAVSKILQRILQGYADDFSKHADNKEVPRIKMIWEGIPRSLAKENKKFRYKDIQTGGRASQFEIALQWLMDTGLAYKVNRITEPRMPLKFYEESSIFKLFMLDVGLLGQQMLVPAENVLVGDNIFSEYKGAFTEQYVFSQMATTEIPIHYFSSNDSRVEVDFVVQIGSDIIPIEAKSEENARSKSLKTYVDKYPGLKGVRFSMKPYIDQGWMENIPLYAVETFVNKKKGMRI
ncbi:MAG: ATP-binding protein [Bacteroidales bacterium]|nr:ATP-binding protein [Bacteroidales bacterium]